MSLTNLSKTPDPRHKTLYRLGALAGILSALSIAFAIVAYFIWPYKGNTTSIEAIFNILQTDRLGALISLDVSMLVIGPITILMFVALYIALWKIDEALALIALILTLLAIGLVIVCRPLVELVMLSDQYAAATDAAEKVRFLAAGEVLRTQLDGTAWTMQTAFFMIAGLVNSTLMLRARFFSKATAWLGIVISAAGLGFFLPGIGLLLLFFNTIGSVPWCLLVARDLLRMAGKCQTANVR
ncbi:MAG: hypothetical protein JXA21_12510 [Anaerolineae bacterium]|nr:hypothetical protein [Anaerolineae bacterium]